MNQLAPITLFAFNRPRHLELTVDSLIQNAGALSSDLILFLNGPRNEKDIEAQHKIDQIISSKNYKARVRLFEIVRAQKNRGLANSIIRGVEHSRDGFNAYREFYLSNGGSLVRRIGRKIKRILMGFTT